MTRFNLYVSAREMEHIKAEMRANDIDPTQENINSLCSDMLMTDVEVIVYDSVLPS